jgi:hypothetical protein
LGRHGLTLDPGIAGVIGAISVAIAIAGATGRIADRTGDAIANRTALISAGLTTLAGLSASALASGLATLTGLTALTGLAALLALLASSRLAVLRLLLAGLAVARELTALPLLTAGLAATAWLIAGLTPSGL